MHSVTDSTLKWTSAKALVLKMNRAAEASETAEKLCYSFRSAEELNYDFRIRRGRSNSFKIAEELDKGFRTTPWKTESCLSENCRRIS
jgi:hypothetical protein